MTDINQRRLLWALWVERFASLPDKMGEAERGRLWVQIDEWVMGRARLKWDGERFVKHIVRMKEGRDYLWVQETFGALLFRLEELYDPWESNWIVSNNERLAGGLGLMVVPPSPAQIASVKWWRQSAIGVWEVGVALRRLLGIERIDMRLALMDKRPLVRMDGPETLNASVLDVVPLLALPDLILPAIHSTPAGQEAAELFSMYDRMVMERTSPLAEAAGVARNQWR